MKLNTNLKCLALLFILAFAGQGCSMAPSLPEGNNDGKITSLTEGFLVEDTRSEVLSSKTEIRPGYQIQFNSAVDEKLSGESRVSHNGELKLPYGGSIRAAGLSLQALTEKVNSELRKYYKADPLVSIKVSDRKYYVEVRGLVQKPGVFLVSEFEKIEAIIQKSNEMGLPKEARVVQINRGQNSFYIDLEEYYQGRNMNLSPKWYGGEKVFFIQDASALAEENSASVQMLGDLRNPGLLPFKDGANIFQYINKAGGPTQSTDLDRVKVVRQTAKGPVLTEGTAEEIARHIKLQPGDTVYMGSSNSTTLERRVQMGASFMSVLTAIGFLIIAF